MSTSKSHMYTANVWCCNMLNIIDVYLDVYFKVTHTANVWYYFKAHMYTANVWCCNMLNIIDVYFKVTHVYSKCVMLYYVEYNRCLLQSHTCIQQMCDVVICWI